MLFKLGDIWRNVPCNLPDKFDCRVTFRDIVEFFERQVRILSDSVLGDILDSPAVAATNSQIFKISILKKSQFYTKPKGIRFAN